MPLDAHLPRIDDRSYDDIVAELRTRIARYTPEWTPVWSDVNDSDPGITLVQLFAWLSEMLLYRMARVPELNYLKFLELIGIELQPAQPASAEVTLAVAAGTTTATVSVPPRTQLGATGDDGEPLVFETTRALTLLACTLQSVQTYDGAQYRDRRAANGDARSAWVPFGELPRVDGALVLGLGFPAGHPNEDSFPALTIDLTVWTAPPPGQQTRVFRCGDASAIAPAQIQWEAWNGAWTPVDRLEDQTAAFTRGGHILLRVPASAALRRDHLGTWEAMDADTGAARPKLFWLRARLLSAGFERAPALLALRLNTVPVEQAQTVQRELLGGTTGARNQRWQLENTPVIRGSARIQIDDGTGAREWRVADDLLGAGRSDEVLALDWASGSVLAGDGDSGAVPVANPANPDANVIALAYRYGGGARGNVGTGRIDHLLSPLDGIDPGQVGNLFGASGGRDEERLDEVRKRARLALRSRDRAVTPEDFEHLAQLAGNVRRAKALPLAHPQFPDVPLPGAVTVVVVPDDGGRFTGLSGGEPPTPSEGLLREVCGYLDQRRLLGTELFVVAPRYVPVVLQATVVVRDDASPAAVRAELEQAWARYLHPLTGGDDGDGWPFGGAIRYSKLVQRAFALASGGVDSVPRLQLTVDGEPRAECRDVAIAANTLLQLVELDVQALTLREAATVLV